MGLFSMLFNEECGNCGSHNTEQLKVTNDLVFKIWEYVPEYGGTIKKVWQCRDCGEYVIYDCYGKRLYTRR